VAEPAVGAIKVVAGLVPAAMLTAGAEAEMAEMDKMAPEAEAEAVCTAHIPMPEVVVLEL
jgi:hypothetical protein